MKNKIPTPKPPPVEPMEITTGSDVQVGAFFGIVAILVTIGFLLIYLTRQFGW